MAALIFLRIFFHKIFFVFTVGRAKAEDLKHYQIFIRLPNLSKTFSNSLIFKFSN
jgi:hypothetical protein